jgi:hypothetical protein
MAERKPSSSAARVRRHRDAMRKQGLKPVTLWLPDVNNPAYIAEVQRQCRLVAEDPHEAEHNDWLAAVLADQDWPQYDRGPEGPPPVSLPGEVAPGTMPKRR